MTQVYQGWTADELAERLDVEKSVPDLGAYQMEGAELSAAARAKFPGTLDIAYGSEPLQKLDVFAPEGAKDAPVFFYIHGGGWRAGSKNGQSITAEGLVPKGIVYVPIDYGLAPDYSMAEIVAHVRSALKWTYDNIAQYGGDPDKIYIGGNSAGGQLTGTLLSPGWHGKYGVPENIAKGTCAMSGVFDLEPAVHASYGFNEQLKMDLEEARTYSPIRHLPKTAGPIIISWGADEIDGFIRQSTDYAKALKEAGLDVTEVPVPGAHHFSMSRQLADPTSVLHKAFVEMVGL